jgi:hypothetical protein
MPLQVQDDFVFHECLPQDSVKKLLNGQFVAAHLPWSKKLEQVIEDITPTRRVKHVLMYRDPRDTFVSYMKYVTNSPSYQRTPRARARQNFMREKFSNDDDRLTYVIQERKDDYSEKYDFLKYEPWLHSSHCCAFKFEDMYMEFVAIKEKKRFWKPFQKTIRLLGD